MFPILGGRIIKLIVEGVGNNCALSSYIILRYDYMQEMIYFLLLSP